MTKGIASLDSAALRISQKTRDFQRFESVSFPDQVGVSSQGRTPHNASKTMTSTWKILYQEEVSGSDFNAARLVS